MRNLLFRYRGLALALPAVVMLAEARPTWLTLAVGGLLALLGEGLRLWAIGYSGEPTRAQELTAPVLVTAGPYSLVRNPLYLGNLLNIAGVAVAGLAAWSWLAPLGAACISWAAYASIISLEEEFLLSRFGAQYEDYRQHVPALWPRRWRQTPGEGRFSRRGWKYEVSSLIWLGLVWLVLLAQRGTW